MPTFPNVALLREQSHAEVFFMCGGAKLWIPSGGEFSACGFDPSKVQVVPDGTLAGVPAKPFVAPPAVKAADVFFSCPKADTRDIFNNLTTQNCKRHDCIIRRNVLIAGWITWDADRAAHPDGPYANSGATGVEDFHYEVVLDPDFIARMYGPGGLTTALNFTIAPGNPPRNPPPPLEELRVPTPFQDVDPTTHQPRGVTLNSFYLPGGGHSLHCELNCWHVNDTWTPFRFNWYGRGPAPAGWVHVPYNGFDDCWWPFDPRNPDGSGPLQPGDYVLMKGTLWEDISHDTPGQPDDWEREPTEFLGGWMEIHPPDWIVKLTPPGPAQHQTYAYLGLVTPFADPANSQSGHLDIAPDFLPSHGNRLRVAGVQELVDGRFTDLGTVGHHTVTQAADHVSVDAEAHSSSGRQGRFKATYIVSWAEEPDPCTPYRDQINALRAQIGDLQDSLAGLNPRLDRAEIRQINAQIATLQAQIHTIQTQATAAAGCGPL